MLIKVGSGFFDDADYAIKLSIVAPLTGVYWGTIGASIWGYTPVLDSCGAAGVAVAGQTYVGYDGAGAVVTAVNAGTCTVAATEMVKVIETNTSAPASDSFGTTNGDPITTWNALWVNMDNLVFDSTVVQPNQVVTVKLETRASDGRHGSVKAPRGPRRSKGSSHPRR
jgi:hypothetical protein